MNTKAEQIAEDAVRKMDNNYGPGALNRKDIILAALIQYATEQNKELVEALKPLARIAELFGSGFKDDIAVYRAGYEESPVDIRITLGDARKAAALLAKHSEKG